MAVDHVIRMLMEMQLIKIVGRSELPGRPMLYGTTALFLEHFGLKDVKELPGITELARMDAMRQKQEAALAKTETAEEKAGDESEKSNPSDPSDQPDDLDDENEFDDEDDGDDEEDEDDEEEEET